jgi:hypothetical protein
MQYSRRSGKSGACCSINYSDIVKTSPGTRAFCQIHLIHQFLGDILGTFFLILQGKTIYILYTHVEVYALGVRGFSVQLEGKYVVTFLNTNLGFDTRSGDWTRPHMVFWSQAAKLVKINTRCEVWKHSHGVLIADLGMKYVHTSIVYIYISEILTSMSLICTWNCAPFARSDCATPNPVNFPRIDILEFWFQNRPGLRAKSQETFFPAGCSRCSPKSKN